jgi:hypothetical protein
MACKKKNGTTTEPVVSNFFLETANANSKFKTIWSDSGVIQVGTLLYVQGNKVEDFTINRTTGDIGLSLNQYYQFDNGLCYQANFINKTRKVFDYLGPVARYHFWEPYGKFYNIVRFDSINSYGVKSSLINGWQLSNISAVSDFTSNPTKVSYKWYTTPAKANIASADSIVSNYQRNNGIFEDIKWQKAHYDKYTGNWFVFSLIAEAGQFYMCVDEVLKTINTNTGFNNSNQISKIVVDLAYYDKDLFKPKITYSEDGKIVALSFYNLAGANDFYSFTFNAATKIFTQKLNKSPLITAFYDVDESGAIIYVDQVAGAANEVKKLDVSGTTVISAKPVEYVNGKFDVAILSLDIFHNRPYLVVGAGINPFNYFADKPDQLSILEFQP